VETTIIVGTSQETSGRDKIRDDEIQRQVDALTEYAKSEGIWVKAFETKYGEILEVCGEARDYFDLWYIKNKISDID
jgi:hypothetical protein